MGEIHTKHDGDRIACIDVRYDSPGKQPYLPISSVYVHMHVINVLGMQMRSHLHMQIVLTNKRINHLRYIIYTLCLLISHAVSSTWLISICKRNLICIPRTFSTCKCSPTLLFSVIAIYIYAWVKINIPGCTKWLLCDVIDRKSKNIMIVVVLSGNLYWKSNGNKVV